MSELLNDYDIEIKKSEDRQFLKKLSRSLSYVLLLMTVLQSVFSMFLILLGFDNGKSSIGETFKLLFSYSFILVILIKLLRKKFVRSLKFKKLDKNFLLYVSFGIFGLFCAISLTLILSSALNTKALELQSVVPDSMGHVILFFLNTVILPGIFEEVIFRGAILELPRKNGDFFCIVVSSVLECLCCSTVHKMVFSLVLSLFLGFIRLKSDSLLPGIVVRLISKGCIAIIIVLKNFFGDDEIAIIKMFMYFALMIIGGIGVFALSFNKKNFYNLRHSESNLNFRQSFLTMFCSFGMVCLMFNTLVNFWVSNNIVGSENSENSTLSYIYEELDGSDVIAVKGSGGSFDSILFIYRYKFSKECLTEVSCQLIFNETDRAQKQFLKIKEEYQKKYSDISIDGSVVQFYFSDNHLKEDYQTFNKNDLINMLEKGELAE